MTDRLVVSNVYKVFGNDPETAMRMLREGAHKDEIFRATGQTVGVRDANFAVREGEIFVVMGLSGSGKSTLVRLLNRLIEPTAGSITIDGDDIVEMDQQALRQLRREKMSMVFQSFALMPHMTVLDNAAFGQELAGVSTSVRRDRAMQALAQVGLADRHASYPSALSGGMQQRVGLARALANDPAILLMDEAFSALDPLIRTEMQDELLQLQATQQRTVIFISHDLNEAMRIGDRIAIMEGGRIVQIGTPDEILSNPADEYVASFFKDVDITKVLTAGDICKREQVTIVDRFDHGVRAAALRLRQFDRPYGMVIDKRWKYHGVVSAHSLAETLSAKRDPELHEAFMPDITPLHVTTPIADTFGRVANSAMPIPVIDDDGYYKGAISPTLLLETLDGSLTGSAEATDTDIAAEAAQ